MSALGRLERAREALDSGRPERALSLLGAFPAWLKGEAETLRGEALRGVGHLERSCGAYRKALPALSPTSDPDLWFDACLGLAAALRSLGRTAEARRRLAQARRAAGVARARREEWELEAALVDRAEGRYAESLARLSLFLARAKRRRDWASAGFLLWAMGGARRFSGDLAGSERDFLESLRLARRAKDDSGQGYALFGLGGIARIRGKLSASRVYYAEAARRFAKTSDLFAKAYGYCGLANALRQMGRFEEARRLYRRSGKLYGALGDRVDGAYVAWGLGKIALQQGQLSRADALLRSALKDFAAGGETRGVVLSRAALAQVWHARGRSAAAEDMLDQAVGLARKARIHAHLEVYT